MPNRNYSYQYETSPRKIKPEYNDYKKTSKKQVNKKTNNKPPKQYNKPNKKEQNLHNKNQEETKSKKKVTAKTKFAVFIKCVIFFGVMFFIIFRNSQISAYFSQIQSLKTSITDLQKENDQLEINIQNSTNLNHIEQQAQELLGMQKRTNKQTVFISLPKKEYVEPRTEEVIIEETKGFIQSLIEKIKEIF